MPYDPRLGYDPDSVAGYEELPPIFVTPDPERAPPAGWQSPAAGMFDPNLPFQLEGGTGYTPQPAAPELRDWAFANAAYRSPNAGQAGGTANRGFGAPMVAPWTPAPAPVAPLSHTPPSFQAEMPISARTAGHSRDVWGVHPSMAASENTRAGMMSPNEIWAGQGANSRGIILTDASDTVSQAKLDYRPVALAGNATPSGGRLAPPDGGLSPLHNEIKAIAYKYPAAADTNEWTGVDVLKWKMLGYNILDFKSQ
ncbi:hypothetical protein G3545_08465 [Starkeya sp. ORNL1]|uniref:hypothetical protein n=1 Tax=Starkeya sp. ORNL1 TaxID=2709380 RepID=UPI001464A617|nr:hypothetical protein [Starkeya sp. ORNL1]QJP13685.1 hypothetical protein G3545_08465 [Starkeya sp. ORNL1]